MNIDIASLIENLPDSVKLDIADFQPVRISAKYGGGKALRVILDRLLTAAEKAEMASPEIIGLDSIARHRYAPEIQKSYFYVKC